MFMGGEGDGNMVDPKKQSCQFFTLLLGASVRLREKSVYKYNYEAPA